MSKNPKQRKVIKIRCKKCGVAQEKDMKVFVEPLTGEVDAGHLEYVLKERKPC